ncbi:phage integrase SAM-like domain-containing protein [Phocaeicola sp.]
MATLNLSVLKSRQTTNGTYIIYVSINHQKETRYIATSYQIDDLYQFDKGKVVCRKDEKIINQRLKYILSSYQEKIDEIIDKEKYSCAQIKDILEGKTKQETAITIKEYMTDRIERLKKEGRTNYAKMNEYTLKTIISILGDITLQSLSISEVEKYSKGLSGQSNATKQMRLAHLKACINEAIKEGFVKYDINPFVYTKMPKSQARQLDITIDEFIKIRNFETVHKKVSLAKDLFLLSFYLGGINLADIVQIDFSKNTINYVRQKTANKKEGEKNITFTVPQEAKPIIKKYIKRSGKLDFGYKFEYHNFQCYLNRCMKILAEKTGITSNFCYYSARKTFSQFAFDLGIKTEIIEYCIGQSMKENRPIYNYVRIMQKQADNAILRVIDYTNNPKKYEDYINMSAQYAVL